MHRDPPGDRPFTPVERLRSDLRYAAFMARLAGRMATLPAPGRPALPEVFFRTARRRAGAEAIRFEGSSLSYGELAERALGWARFAARAGIAPGDVVALHSGNSAEMVAAFLGLARAGAVVAMIHERLTGRPLAHSLEVSGATHLLLEAEVQDAFGAVRRELARPPSAWVFGGPAREGEDAGAALREAARAEVPPPPARGGRDPLCLIFTSGTTGLPKAARMSHLRYLAGAAGLATAEELSERDRLYLVLPLYHAAGLVLGLGSALLTGATTVLRRRFSAGRFFEECRDEGVTCFSYIGELCRYLLAREPAPAEQEHRIRCAAGNGLREDVWRQVVDRFRIPRVIEFYGATEGNLGLINLDGRIGRVGRVPGFLRPLLAPALVRHDPETGEPVRGADGFCVPCAPGEAGEALVRITALAPFEGYTDAEATRRKVLRDVFRRGDRYFRTGDLLREDRDGFYEFVDRVGDTFRWKGENVSTAEVEAVFAGLPGLREIAVYGVPVPGAEGRVGMAAVALEPDWDPEKVLGALAERAAAELPSFARPRFVRVVPALEHTATFKVRKVELARQGFDPGAALDPLFLLEDAAGEPRYRPFGPEQHRALLAGELRL